MHIISYFLELPCVLATAPSLERRVAVMLSVRTSVAFAAAGTATLPSFSPVTWSLLGSRKADVPRPLFWVYLWKNSWLLLFFLPLSSRTLCGSVA